MNLDTPSMDRLELRDKRVLVRVDFNVPFDESGAITDDTRIRAALPTIGRILNACGRPVLMSHLGRPKGKVVDSMRLTPVARRLEELISAPVVALRESTGPAVEQAIADAPAGSVVLLENVRFHPGETAGDPELSKAFARLGDVFVNDAFGSSHRDHCSVSGVARLLPSAAGLLLQREIEAFKRVLDEPERPLVAVLGGAKVSDKLTVIDNLLDKVDRLLVGGGMAYTFLAAKGYSTGKSLLQADQLGVVEAAIAKAEERGVELILPSDHVCGAEFSADTAPIVTKGPDVPDDAMGLDIGPASQTAYANAVAGARTLVWNGPMGVFEWEAFRKGTETVGRAVASCAGYTVVGGGDSVAAIALLGLTERIDHISTGGGASLELLEGRELPGIAALDAKVAAD
jgi:phosphoglycerate kinase